MLDEPSAMITPQILAKLLVKKVKGLFTRPGAQAA